MVNQKYLDKAEVLIEALPYIQRFNRKIVVVKYGGSAMLDDELKKNVIKDVVLLKLVGFKPIIVHGGGKEISRWVGKVGMEPKFINGLRVTDKDTMEIAEMVLAKVNKELVAMVESLGVNAVVYIDDVKGLDIEKIGPLFETHPCFPDRVNTEFSRVLDDHTVEMRVWERGAGETLACGTGACAVAVASILNGYVVKDQPVTIKLLGGDLEIFWDQQKNTVFMTGPAEVVFDGEIKL